MSGLWNFEYINNDELSYRQPDQLRLWVAEDEISILSFLNLTLIYFLLLSAWAAGPGELDGSEHE